jgi:hypothetical protein
MKTKGSKQSELLNAANTPYEEGVGGGQLHLGVEKQK